MNDLDQPEDEDGGSHPRRRRRRRDFLEALQQSQAVGRIPLVDVGQRLREIRMDCGFTIRDLARKSGLNVNTLSMIENGKASPSLETLQQLSFTLETPIAAFFEDNRPKNKIAHYKASQRPSITFAHGTLEDLGTGMPRRGAETFLVTLKPHSNSGENLMVHTGREAVFCLEGQLTYTIEDQAFLLEPGDSLFFEAHLPHRWQNTGATPARTLLVLCPSDEQDRPTERHFAPETTRTDVE
ncbi:MAG: cupin domain-containing protein [Anaerolineales bacterium]|nr:cupin domain-containing protein [Anaerolineales bacterium]